MSLHLIIYTIVSVLFIGVSLVALYFLNGIGLVLCDILEALERNQE